MHKNSFFNKLNLNINKQNNRGITLIALVITIIVLLILAGVSISMLTGSNGILTQASNAKQATEESTEKEKRQLSQIEAKYDTNKAIEDAYSIGRDGNIFKNNLEIFKRKIKNKNIEVGIDYNQELLDNIINEIAVKIPGAVEKPSYCIEDKKLTITKGKAGNTINKEKFRGSVEKTFKKRKFDADLMTNLSIVKESKVLRERWLSYSRKNSYARDVEFEETLECLEKLIDILILHVI